MKPHWQRRPRGKASPRWAVAVLLGKCLWCLHTGVLAQSANKEPHLSGGFSGTGAGLSFPLGGFSRHSGGGFHSMTFVEWSPGGRVYLRALFDFSTYPFTAVTTQAGFAVRQEANRTLITGLLVAGYRRQAGKWSLAGQVGNGVAYFTVPALAVDVAQRTIAARRQARWHYTLLTGIVATYELTPSFRPFLELSVTYLPGARVAGNAFLVWQPTLGVRFPLSGIVHSIFKRK